MTNILISCSLFFNHINALKYKFLYKNIIDTLNVLENAGYNVNVVIYYDSSVGNEIITDLELLDNVITVKKPDSNKRSGCFWRYEAVNDFKEYDIYLFRDIDLQLEHNDLIIINNFVDSNRSTYYTFVVHTRKVYPRQGFLMGGLFGIKKSIAKEFCDSFIEWKKSNALGYYGSDEEFLAKTFYLKDKCIVFIEPRVKNARLTEDFFKNISLDYDHEEYIELEINYTF